MTEVKQKYEHNLVQMREDMRRIKDEWEKRLAEEQIEC
jgi:hypothetical protein